MIGPSRHFATAVFTVGLSWVRQRRMAALLLAAAVSSVLPLSAEAALATTTPSTPGVIPPTVSVQGRTYSQWSVAQWQWELEQPNNPQSPVVDPNPSTASNPEPVDCTLDQSGSVWFLAGISVSQNYQTAYRACSIPSGKYLFFPVVDGWNDNLNCPDLGKQARSRKAGSGFVSTNR